MKNLLFVAAAAGAFLLPAVSQAAPAHSYHLTTVKWILTTRNDLKVDDHYVTLVGHITDRDDDGDYFFTDGTGTIRLDPGTFKIPRGEKIVIGGRIDQAYLGFGHIEVDVLNYHHPKNSGDKAASVKPAGAKPKAAAPASAPAPVITTTPEPAAISTPAVTPTFAPAPEATTTAAPATTPSLAPAPEPTAPSTPAATPAPAPAPEAAATPAPEAAPNSAPTLAPPVDTNAAPAAK